MLHIDLRSNSSQPRWQKQKSMGVVAPLVGSSLLKIRKEANDKAGHPRRHPTLNSSPAALTWKRTGVIYERELNSVHNSKCGKYLVVLLETSFHFSFNQLNPYRVQDIQSSPKKFSAILIVFTAKTKDKTGLLKLNYHSNPEEYQITRNNGTNNRPRRIT